MSVGAMPLAKAEAFDRCIAFFFLPAVAFIIETMTGATMADSNTAVSSIAKQGAREVPASQTLLTVADVGAVLRLCRTAVWNLRKVDPNFPRPLDIPGVGLRFSASAVRAYARRLKPRPVEAATAERPAVKPPSPAADLARRAREAKGAKRAKAAGKVAASPATATKAKSAPPKAAIAIPA